MWTQTIFRLLALSLSGGILCGILWDVFSIPRIIFGIPESDTGNKFHTVVLFMEDLIFCFFCGLVAILVLYYGNDGNIRGIAFVGMSAGFAAYRVTFGALAQICTKKLCCLVSRICSKLTRFCKKLYKKYKKEKIKEE